jgi:E3 ubiquitin-protein ligase BRE1
VNLLDYICRDVMELQQAECRARAQVERLKLALDEHSLELRVKAANEAEAVCQQRLTAAEAEIAELRQRLDALDRFET